MKETPVELSICIPTNGVDDFIFDVLESIFIQNVSKELFEVIVMDNGNNIKFKEKMISYAENKSNLYFYETNAELFMGEIESYKKASGKFIKFINHRTRLLPGTIDYYLDFVRRNQDKRPIVYFSNGVLNKNTVETMASFDRFVYELSYWSSWSTGMGIWKEDLKSVLYEQNKCINFLFPHTTILLNACSEREYIIDDTLMLIELRGENIKKGKYDLFYAFCVEYPMILCDLYRNKHIRANTLKKILNDNLNLIAFFYHGFVMNKKKTNYDIRGFNDAMDIFYTKEQIESRMLDLYGSE